MIRSKRSVYAILVRAGLVAVSILLTRCSLIPAELPAQEIKASESTQADPVSGEMQAADPTATSTPTMTPVPPTPDAPIRQPGGPGAASNLQSTVQCEKPGKPVAWLSWTPAEEKGTAQRVDVTIYSFEDEQFDSSELLEPDQSTYTWERMRGQAIHYWRVLTLHEEGWVPSETAGFVGPTCVGKDQTPTPDIIR